jgi:Uma2 family endonuclease
MSQTLVEVSAAPVAQPFAVLRMRPAVELSHDQFFELCQINRELRLERTAEGDIIVLPPSGFETGNRNHEIARQLGNWTIKDGTGVASDSSGGFILPNGADRSPDAAWIKRERLSQLTPEQKKKLLPLCPDFVIELRSPSDRLEALQAKMEEYIENGVRLGWLIDPQTKSVNVYRTGESVEVLRDVLQVSGEPELPGFVLDLREIWNPDI